MTLIVLEGVVRIFIPQQLILLRPDVWVPEEGLGWRQASNLNTTINTGERQVQLYTDQDGHRVGSHHQDQGAYRILTLGDSYLAALQVEYEQTMTARLEENLSAMLGDKVIVVNTGVAGWDLNHYLIKIRQELAQRRYNLILVFIYMPNDIIKRQVDRYAPKQSSVRHRLRLPRSLETGELINTVAYPINNFLEVRSHFYIFFKDKARFILMSMGLSAYAFSDAILQSEAESPRWILAGNISAGIAAEATAHNTPILFILLPANYQTDITLTQKYVDALNINPNLIDLDQPGRLLRTELEIHGLSVVNTTEPLRAAHVAGQTDLYGKIDTHFGIDGHRVVANLLEPILMNILIPKTTKVLTDKNQQ